MCACVSIGRVVRFAGSRSDEAGEICFGWTCFQNLAIRLWARLHPGVVYQLCSNCGSPFAISFFSYCFISIAVNLSVLFGIEK